MTNTYLVSLISADERGTAQILVGTINASTSNGALGKAISTFKCPGVLVEYWVKELAYVPDSTDCKLYFTMKAAYYSASADTLLKVLALLEADCIELHNLRNLT